jgi:hypothetical protein
MPSPTSRQVLGLPGAVKFAAMLPVGALPAGGAAAAPAGGDKHLVMATASGSVKRTSLGAFASLATSKRRWVGGRRAKGCGGREARWSQPRVRPRLLPS